MKPVEVYLAADESVITNLPPGTVLRVHHPHETRDYTATHPDNPVILLVDGDQPRGWPGGILAATFTSLSRFGSLCHPADREVWDVAVQTITQGGAAIIEHQLQPWQDGERWAVTGFRAA